MESENPTEETKKVEKVNKSGRVYKGTKEIDHDLYKLQVAEAVKNHSWWSAKPTFIGHEHTHMFHSFDSSGKEQFYSTMTAGHCHRVMFERDENGMIIEDSIQIGPPVRRTKKGDMKIVVQHDAEGRPVKHDNHTHEMQYIHSERITVRKKNEAAAKAMAEHMMKRDQKLKVSSIEEAEANTL